VRPHASSGCVYRLPKPSSRSVGSDAVPLTPAATHVYLRGAGRTEGGLLFSGSMLQCFLPSAALHFLPFYTFRAEPCVRVRSAARLMPTYLHAASHSTTFVVAVCSLRRIRRVTTGCGTVARRLLMPGSRLRMLRHIRLCVAHVLQFILVTPPAQRNSAWRAGMRRLLQTTSTTMHYSARHRSRDAYS